MVKEKSFMSISSKTEKIILEKSKWGLGIELNSFIREALDQKMITIYEAFQLYETSDRLCHSEIKNSIDSYDVVSLMNMALVARLFNENALYEQYCCDANERLDLWFKILKKLNNGKLPKGKHYILSDLGGFLSGDLEHMKKLSRVRTCTSRRNPGVNLYHFECFPYDYFAYEDELIKVLNGESDHYKVDKTISHEVCEMMTAIELRAIELE